MVKYHPDHEHREYVPHMTIGERIPAGEFPEVKRRFRDTVYDWPVSVTSFTLFQLTNDRYRPLMDFSFGG